MRKNSLWRNRNFRTIFAASTVSHLGSGVSAVAFPWFASLLTRDPWLIGFVAMAPQLPWLLFALPFGVLTDRLDHRRTIVASDGVRAGLTLLVAGLALVVLAGTPAVLSLALIAFLLGTAEVLRDNTAQTLLPSIIDKNHLEAANAAMWSANEVVGRFMAPPLAGVLISLGIALAFGFDAAMLATAALLIGRLTMLRAAARSVQGFWPALQEGVRWLWAHGQLRRLAMVLGAYNFLSSMIWSVMVLYAQDILGLNAVGYGALLSALAAGGLGGSLAAPWIIRRVGPSRGLQLSISGFVLASGVLIFTTNPWVAGVALMTEAAASMVWNIITVSYRQRHIPPELLGRVNAAYRFVGSGTLPLGSLAGGALVAAAAPLGPFALHVPFVAATAGAAMMLIYAALQLRLD